MSNTKPFRFAIQGANATSGTEWKDLARRTEQLGYSTLHLADHYLGPGSIADAHKQSTQSLAAIPAMATAAAVTETLRVGCRVFCVDYHLPAVLAKSVATLDLMTDGRVEVGLGAGWTEIEYEGMGVPFDSAGTRIRRLAEYTALIKAYFSGEEIDIDGEDVHVHGYRGTPAPVQQPRPPIMIGGGAQKVLTLAGAEADIVSLNFNNRAGVVGPDGVGASVASETDRKVGWVRDGAGDRFDSIELEIGAYFTAVTDDPMQSATMLGGLFGLSPEVMIDHPHALIGSIGEICERLEQRRERYGISYITVPDRHVDAFAPVVEALAGH
jgi:probable F420-dependent oxidoreductase